MLATLSQIVLFSVDSLFVRSPGTLRVVILPGKLLALWRIVYGRVLDYTYGDEIGWDEIG